MCGFKLLKCKTIIECKKNILTKVFYYLEAKYTICEKNANGYHDDPVDGLFVSNKLSTTKHYQEFREHIKNTK